MRSVDRGAKKLRWMQFLQALELCAATRRIGVEKVQELIMACAGPSLNRPSLSEPVRLHDDKALYTGVHVVGGPSTVDNKVTLDRLVRSPHADVRGVDHSKHYSDAEAGVSSGHHVGLSPSRSMPTPPRPARTPPVKLTPRSPVVPPPVENAVPPPPPDFYDVLTRYFLRHNPSKAANVGGLLARYAGDEASLFAKIEAKSGAPVIADDNSMRTPAKSVFDKLTDSRQYTGSHRTIHRDGPEPPSSGVRWFSPD